MAAPSRWRAAKTALCAFTMPPLTDNERKLTFCFVPGLLTGMVGLNEELMMMCFT